MRTLALSFAVAVVVGTVAVAGAGSIPVSESQPVSAVKLQLKEKNGKQKLLFLSKDTNVMAPSVGGPNDPQDVGAELTLCASNGDSASFAFVAENWTVNSSGTVYKFKVKGKPVGPKVGLLKGAKTLKLVGGAVGLNLNGTLGAVGVRFRTGTLTQCTRFDSIKKDEPGSYDARNAVAPSDCSVATLCSSPIGSFVN
jgi:hypothetical protein